MTSMKQLCGVATKKPVSINFFVWNGWSASHIKEVKAWVESFGTSFQEVFERVGPGIIKVKTLEGHSYDLPAGYIIIRGVEGEFYPCEPGIFKKTYNYDEN